MADLPVGSADERGGVADEKNDGVAKLLEVAQLAHQHGVAQVKVGRGRVEAGLDAQRRAGLARLLRDAVRRSSLLSELRGGRISAAPLVSSASWSSTR